MVSMLDLTTSGRVATAAVPVRSRSASSPTGDATTNSLEDAARARNGGGDEEPSLTFSEAAVEPRNDGDGSCGVGDHHDAVSDADVTRQGIAADRESAVVVASGSSVDDDNRGVPLVLSPAGSILLGNPLAKCEEMRSAP